MPGRLAPGVNRWARPRPRLPMWPRIGCAPKRTGRSLVEGVVASGPAPRHRSVSGRAVDPRCRGPARLRAPWSSRRRLGGAC